MLTVMVQPSLHGCENEYSTKKTANNARYMYGQYSKEILGTDIIIHLELWVSTGVNFHPETLANV